MNIQDFNYFSFAVFESDDILSVINLLREIFSKGKKDRKIICEIEDFNVKRFFNPTLSGVGNRLFCIWKIKSTPHRLFLTSDGDFSTVCNAISLNLKYNFVKCTMYRHDDMVYPYYSFTYSNCKENRRSIVVYKDPKWIFFEQGIPLPFEDLSLYQTRLVKNRLNNAIIIQYLSKLGIDFYSIDKDVTESYTIKVES